MTELETRVTTKTLNIVGKAFKIEWCDTCKSLYIRCPMCGMNTCSGGYGEDKKGCKCSVCPIAYDIHNALQAYLVSEEPCSE